MGYVETSIIALRGAYETLAISAPTVIESMQGRVTREVCDRRIWRYGARLIQQAQIDLRVEGAEQLLAHGSERFVVMSNHKSHYDIPVIFHGMPGRSIRMVTKSEITRIPIWGHALLASGFVSVERRNREKAIESLQHATSALDPAIDLWISPEGGRSRTPVLQPFKKGGFHLACDLQRRILPVALIGTNLVCPPDSFQINTGKTVTMRIGAPIETAKFKDDLTLLMDLTYHRIHELLTAS